MRAPCDTLPPFDHVNTYVVASNGVALVVDPGSAEPAAAAGLREALGASGARLVKGVLLTHTHPDHVGGLGGLLPDHDPPAVYVHPAEAARLELPSGLHPTLLYDDRRVVVGDAVVRAVATPGHSPGHLAFQVEDDGLVLVGDLLAGDGSTWVGVPEGDVAAYLASLARVGELRPGVMGPGHGEPIRDPEARLAWAREHRLERERQVLGALEGGPLALAELRARVYPDARGPAAPYAEASLLAHLLKLMRELRVVHLGEDPQGPYALKR